VILSTVGRAPVLFEALVIRLLNRSSKSAPCQRQLFSSSRRRASRRPRLHSRRSASAGPRCCGGAERRCVEERICGGSGRRRPPAPAERCGLHYRRHRAQALHRDGSIHPAYVLRPGHDGAETAGRESRYAHRSRQPRIHRQGPPEADADFESIAKSLEQSFPDTNRAFGAALSTEIQTRMDFSKGDSYLVALLFNADPAHC
jgi:hypothetical protein